MPDTLSSNQHMHDLVLRWLATAISLQGKVKYPEFSLAFAAASQPNIKFTLIVDKQPRIIDNFADCESEVLVSDKGWQELHSGQVGPQELLARGELKWSGSAEALMAWSYLAFLTKERRCPQRIATF